MSERGGDKGDGLELDALRRQSALETLKKQLAAREVPTPQLEGYPLQKARKILSLVGVSPERIRLRLTEHPGERGTTAKKSIKAAKYQPYFEDNSHRFAVRSPAP